MSDFKVLTTLRFYVVNTSALKYFNIHIMKRQLLTPNHSLKKRNQPHIPITLSTTNASSKNIRYFDWPGDCSFEGYLSLPGSGAELHLHGNDREHEGDRDHVCDRVSGHGPENGHGLGDVYGSLLLVY